MAQNISKMFTIYNFTAHRLNFFQKKISKQDLINTRRMQFFSKINKQTESNKKAHDRFFVETKSTNMFVY